MKLNKILIGVGFIVLLVIGALFIFYRTSTKDKSEVAPKNEVTNSNSADIVSTNPNPLEGAVIPADTIIEITFNKPLRAPSEFKVKIGPEIDFKIEVSEDRKTAKIIPTKPYELGMGYTVHIGPETKFDGIDRWGKEITYHFQTIKFRGI